MVVLAEERNVAAESSEITSLTRITRNPKAVRMITVDAAYSCHDIVSIFLLQTDSTSKKKTKSFRQLNRFPKTLERFTLNHESFSPSIWCYSLHLPHTPISLNYVSCEAQSDMMISVKYPTSICIYTKNSADTFSVNQSPKVPRGPPSSTVSLIQRFQEIGVSDDKSVSGW